MLDVRRIECTDLRRFARGEKSKIARDWQPRLNRILFLLDAATHPEDLSMLGARFRELTGPREGTYAVQVTGDVYVTYRWSDEGHPVAVDLESLT